MERPWSYDKNFLSHDRFRKYQRFPSSVVFGARVSDSGCDLNVAESCSVKSFEPAVRSLLVIF